MKGNGHRVIDEKMKKRYTFPIENIQIFWIQRNEKKNGKGNAMKREKKKIGQFFDTMQMVGRQLNGVKFNE